jgi:pyruvate dehydrogenase E2 component (dihydrolipoamide acetyltransferase)
VRADVERAAAHAAPAEAPAPVARPAPAPPLTRYAAMWRATGALMARSKREIPHYYLRSEIDLSRALAWLGRANAARALTERIVPAALLLRAVALGAREVPELIGFWVDDAFQPAEAVHLGVAVSLRHGGLAAPALLHAERKPLPTLMRDLRDLVRRTRASKLRATEMSEPTLTVTSLGDQGVESVFGVIYPPQVALVGFGKVSERPFAAGGMMGARPLVTATLAGDHRASDGHRGARFLTALDRLLQAPDKL